MSSPLPHVKIKSTYLLVRESERVRVSHDQLTTVRLFFGCSERTNGGGHASESEEM